MTNPATLTTAREWTEYLGELLREASAASGSGDATRMQQAQEKLLQFEALSPAYADELDNTALRAVIALDISNTTARVAQLETLIEEYRRVSKIVEAAAADPRDS